MLTTGEGRGDASLFSKMELEHVATSASHFCIMDIYQGVFNGKDIRVIDEAVSGQIFVYRDGTQKIATFSSGKRFFLGLTLDAFVAQSLMEDTPR